MYIAVENFPELVPSSFPKSKIIHLHFSGKTINDAIYFSKILRKYNIDLLHSWDYKSNLVEALSCHLAGIKYLFTKKNNAWSRRWYLKGLLAHHIAYDNPEMKNRFFKSWFISRKISFIPHGVDLNVFKPQEPKISVKFKICSIGNITSNKNQADIIKALHQLPDDVVLELYGRADKLYKVELNKLIDKLDLNQRVHFKGFVENSDVPKVLSEQDLFVLSSKQEGLPVSILEALACGVPVLSSDSGGGTIYILQANRGGYVYKSLDDLIEKIRVLKDDSQLYKRLSKSAIENVNSRFSKQLEISAYKDLYLKLLN